MVRLGLLKESERKLDYVLGLTIAQFMERRLQTLVVKRKIAQSVHHARILIRQRHIAVGKQMVNVPSFVVRVSSEQHIQHANRFRCCRESSLRVAPHLCNGDALHCLSESVEQLRNKYKAP